ncbi:MAG TPA: AAA family ATPase, partial [Candidatus Limnocylindrales bacterium]
MGATTGATTATPGLRGASLDTLRLTDLRSYSTLDVAFGPGAHLVWGPNAAGKTSLLEAMVVLARGGSHRTTTDAELVRWGSDIARIEGRAGDDAMEVALVRPGSAAAASGARKRIRVNGVPRRATALADRLRVVLFAPEDMLLVAGSPSLRRTIVDQLGSTLLPGYAANLATYGRALQ